ncbi:MAG: hypothetical protein HQK89_12805 [Nitrospirae bacterium]|nr:hypothetical protein [Nitrospirota bacterium]
MIIFNDDDKEYLDWVKRHHDTGFVGNVAKTYATPAGRMCLHKTCCPTVGTVSGRHTSEQFMKVCSTKLADIEDYARVNNLFVNSCRMHACDPLPECEGCI